MASSVKQAPLSCPGHTRPVVDICFSGETEYGILFITASKDCKAIMRRGDTGDWIGTFLGHKGAVWSCVLDAKALRAATGAADFTAKVWDTTTGMELLSISQDHIVRCVDLSRTDSGARLLTANNMKNISLYDLNAPQQALVTLDGHDQIIRRLLWCNADRMAISVSEDKTVRLWDLSSPGNKPVQSYQLRCKQMPDSVTDVQFHLDSDQTLSDAQAKAVIACGKSVQLYTLDWRFLSESDFPDPNKSFQLPYPIYSASLHPKENTLVCGGDDHLIYRFDTTSGEILESCKGHFGPIHCVRFSPDGNLFASGSEDGTVRLWQNVIGRDFGLWKLSIPSQDSYPFPTNNDEQKEVLSARDGNISSLCNQPEIDQSAFV